MSYWFALSLSCSSLPLDELLDIADKHIEKSGLKTNNLQKRVRHCNKALVTLRLSEKRCRKNKHERIAACYHEHYILLLDIDCARAGESRRKAEEWGYSYRDSKLTSVNSIYAITQQELPPPPLPNLNQVTNTSSNIPEDDSTYNRKSTAPVHPTQKNNPSYSLGDMEPKITNSPSSNNATKPLTTPTTEKLPQLNEMEPTNTGRIPQHEMTESEQPLPHDESDSRHYALKPSDSGNFSEHSHENKLNSAQTEPLLFTKPELPIRGSKLKDTIQLAYALNLLNNKDSKSDEQLSEEEHKWLRDIRKHPSEKDRLRSLATEMMRKFEEKPTFPGHIEEIVYLAPVLPEEEFLPVLSTIVDAVKNSALIPLKMLKGLSQLMQYSPPDYIDGGHLVDTLIVLSNRLSVMGNSTPYHQYMLAVAICRVLDAMVSSGVEGLSLERLYQPLGEMLSTLRKSVDPYLEFQAVYALHALQRISSDETRVEEILRRGGKVIQGVFGLVSGIKSFDINHVITSLNQISEGTDLKIVERVGDIYNRIVRSRQNGLDAIESFREAFSFFPSQGANWYPALRALDSTMERGNFAEFEKLIRECKCANDLLFQWGLCQKLGEIAADERWTSDTCQRAIDLLGEMYKGNRGDHKSSLREWIVSILSQVEFTLNKNNGCTIASHIKKILGEISNHTLERRSNHNTPDIKKRTIKDNPVKNNHIINLNPVKFPLLRAVQLNASEIDLESEIEKLKERRLNSHDILLKEQDKEIYIPLMAKKDVLAEDKDGFDLMTYVLEFAKEKKKKGKEGEEEVNENGKRVFLLRGSSGSGKSTFNRKLEIQLWENYKRGGKIPLFIHLPTIKDVEHCMIQEQLRNENIGSVVAKELKKKGREFILICDGYDECQLGTNLFNLYHRAGWRTQMVISCRTEYLPENSLEPFIPATLNHRPQAHLLQQAVIIPFNKNQIIKYVHEYTDLKKYRNRESTNNNHTWDSGQYENAFEKTSNLLNIAKNPFVLKMAMDVLPSLVKQDPSYSDSCVTRVEIYDRVMQLWLSRSRIRLNDSVKQGTPDYDLLQGFKDFGGSGIEYIKNLAKDIYFFQDGNPSIQYQAISGEKKWSGKYFSDRSDKRLLRDSVPLYKEGVNYRFIHASYLEYALSLAVFDPQYDKQHIETVNHKTPVRNKSTRGSKGNTHLPSSQLSKDDIRKEHIDRLLDSPLGLYYFVAKKSSGSREQTETMEGRECLSSDFTSFLVDRARKHPEFKSQLLALVENSKMDNFTDGEVGSTNRSPQIAAANSMTILVKAGFSFNNVDFKGIRISKADLSYGMFDSTRFDNADLSGTILRNAWFRGSTFIDAKMNNVFFGERPYIEENQDQINDFCFLPDGEHFGLVLSSDKIKVFDTSNRKQIRERNYDDEISSEVFSPDGCHVAVGSVTGKIRIYDIKTDKIVCEIGPTLSYLEKEFNLDKVSCLTYSPNGVYLVAGNCDKSIIIWNTQSEEIEHAIENAHKDDVDSIVYSPSGVYFASFSCDGKMIFWNATTYKKIQEFEVGVSKTVAFAPEGNKFVFTSSTTDNQHKLEIWETNSRKCNLVYKHLLDGSVSNVLFSPDGNEIAFTIKASNTQIKSDDILVIWDAKSYKTRHQLKGHSGSINSMMYSPDGCKLATGGADKKILLWDTENGKIVQTLDDHASEVTRVLYSPKGNILASCEINTVRLWEVDFGLSVRNFTGHSKEVSSISSSNGRVISASKDGLARIWDSKNGELCLTLTGSDNPVEYATFSSGGRRIVTVSNSHKNKTETIQLWKADLNNDRTMESWKVGCSMPLNMNANVVHVAYSPSDRIALGMSNRTIYVCNTNTEKVDRIISSENLKDISSLALSPDGSFVVSGTVDGVVTLWDANGESGKDDSNDHNDETGQTKFCHILEGPVGDVTSIAFSSNGDRIASCGIDKKIHIWKTMNGKSYKILSPECSKQGLNPDTDTEFDTCIAFSPCNKFIITGSSKSNFSFWDIKSGRRNIFKSGGRGKVLSLLLLNKELPGSHSSITLIVGSEDGSVRKWSFDNMQCENPKLDWSTTHDALNIFDASFEKAQGLSNTNMLLLKQRAKYPYDDPSKETIPGHFETPQKAERSQSYSHEGMPQFLIRR